MKANQNMKQNIIYSIVLCTYNRERHIQQCLKSLVNQNFPKDRYEIIVVDDGSTDSTIELVKKFPVRLIQHKTNSGLAEARNTGLYTAKGKIYICFDDDCYADKNWLKELDNVYKKYGYQNLSGVAGFIKLHKQATSIVDYYMDATGYANPSPISYVTSKSLFMRFYSYLRNMFSPNMQTSKTVFKVGEIWGANCSFPISILKKVKGWDKNLSGVEDTDLCYRINKTIKNSTFLCTKKATLFHDHRLSIKNLIKKPFTRGTSLLKFYSKIKKIPPIFPFPFFVISSLIILFVINPLSIFFNILILPQIFYGWWLLKAIKKQNPVFIIFPYLQCTYELSTVLGMLKGYIKNNSELNNLIYNYKELLSYR